MKYPETPGEFRSVLQRLTAEGAFFLVPDEAVLQAAEEFVRAIEGAYVGESTLTASERLCGLLFIEAIEFAVTSGAFDEALVTIQET